MRDRTRNMVVILMFVFLTLTIFSAPVQADDWTQTSQSDFDSGIKTNVDTIIDPGNVTLTKFWNKYPTNPVLDAGPPGSWDDFWATHPSILYDGTTYKMWYTGHDIINARIGYATSPDGITWTKFSGNPVLNLGPPGSWEEVYVYCSTVLYDGTMYKMWYSGGDKTNSRIGYATSLDGIIWTKFEGNPVLNLGPPSSWDDYHVYCPTVVYDDTTYRIWYSGNDGFNSRVGYAISLDGIKWTKSGANPVVDLGPSGSWDDEYVYYPTVLYDSATYKMWYTGYDGSYDRIGYATSPDGTMWTKNADNPVLDLGPSGSWDDVEVCCPFVLYDSTTYKMWYSGDDGSNNRIGYAILSHHPSGNLTSTVFDSGASGTVWNFINWTEYLPQGTNITLATRSGSTPTPDASWSPWSTEMWDEIGSPITSPRSRHIQYRANLTTNDYNMTPILSEVNINYNLNTAQHPILASPANDTWITDNTPTFTWIFADLEGDSQTGFTVQIDNDSSFSSIDYTSGDVDSGDPWWIPSLPIADGIWYWRVRIRDTYNLWSVYSNYWVIKIDTTFPPGAEKFRTVGFWIHQCRAALNENKGHQHIDTPTLLTYLQWIAERTAVPEFGASGKALTIVEMCEVLDLKGKQTMKNRALHQLLAVWLNYANSASSLNTMVDTDWDCTPDMALGEAIETMEEIINDSNSTKAEYEYAKDMADSINNGGEGCYSQALSGASAISAPVHQAANPTITLSQLQPDVPPFPPPLGKLFYSRTHSQSIQLIPPPLSL